MSLRSAYDALWADDCPPIEPDEAPRRSLPTQRQAPIAGPRCISIRPPYGTWIVNPQRFIDAGLPPKAIENRDSDLSNGYRGLLIIHQSKTFESNAIPAWQRRIPGIEQIFSMEQGGYPHGAIIGLAELVDVIEDSDDPWFVGEYGLVLANARPVYPVPYRGYPWLFNIPANIVEQLEEIK
jgi:hypothetical protein